MDQKLLGEIRALAESLTQENKLGDLNFYKNKVGALYERLVVASYLQENPLPSESSDQSVQVPTHDPLTEPATEKIKDIVAQMPEETVLVDDLIDEIITPKHDLNEIEVFAAEYQQIPEFEPKEIVPQPELNFSENTTDIVPENKPTPPQQDVSEKQKSLNEKIHKSAPIGLNDRLAFTKHLFNGNAEDYHRVMSQISTMTTLSEVQYFIDHIVRPDYNWEGKEYYVDKFTSFFAKKFE